MFTLEKAKSGELTLLYNGKSIHSKYDPKSEAFSFLKKQLIKTNSHLFILIGPGLGYLKLAILESFPDAKILSLHMDEHILKNSLKHGETWTYGEKNSISFKLSSFIPDFQLSETTILKWTPCTNLFPSKTKEIEKNIEQFFQERKGTLFTTAVFGKVWIRNIQNNYNKINKYNIIKNIKSVIIIAASGPSLNDDIELLKINRNKYILAALPSSLSALNNAEIIPDFIFHTDPGFWSKEHLKNIKNTKIPIIMPLTASFFYKLTNPVILFNQGSFLENYLLNRNSSFIKIPPHGTVAGTAYLFFRQITSNPIIYMGLDFCYRDIEEHVNPHSFDILYLSQQNRFSGYLHQLYEKHQDYCIKNSELNTNQAYSTYSGWFNNKDRIINTYRYKPSNIKTKGLNIITTSVLTTMLTSNSNSYSLLDNSVETNNFLTNNKIIKLFNDLFDLIIDFNKSINFFNEDTILELFTKQSLLLEFFQYTSYLNILELSHYYRTDEIKSREILKKIYKKSLNYILKLLERYNYGK